tara:strand:+ start:10289 stop:11992 length:1704 start_codon:yes stop_codon:yes gene_type:complete
MDNRRIFLWVALFVVGFLLFQAWQKEHMQQPAPAAAAQQQQQTATVSNGATHNNSVPSVLPTTASDTSSSSVPATVKASTSSAGVIHVKTDVLDITIDKRGGGIVGSELSKYPQALGSKQSVQLLNQNGETYYTAASGITGTQGPDTQKNGPVVYQTTQSSYTLKSGQKSLDVNLVWRGNGLLVTKTYTFRPDHYEVGMTYKVQNLSAKSWSGRMYLQLLRKEPPKNASMLHYAMFTGAAVSSPAETYQKFSFSKLGEGKLNQAAAGGWAAMVQHYFLSAWVPMPNQSFHYSSSEMANGTYTVNLYGPELTAAAGKTVTTAAKFYTGPAIAKRLDGVAPHLSMTIDYGWLWFISIILFWIMTHIYAVVGNWGIAIILLTIIIKLVFFHLSTKSYRSMAHMRRLQPRMAQLKERHGDDKQAFSKAMMEMYKKEKVNPVGSCLPMLIQIPFFIALYYMIIESVQLRQAPFFLWIHDLSIADPYYVLPIIMGALMFLQQRLNPPAPDPMQQKIMMFLPVVFTIFFLTFPAGLVLYWITNTGFGMVHQWWCLRSVTKYENEHKGHHRPMKK